MPVDVEILQGKVPAELEDGVQACGEYDISGPDILLRAPNAGRILIQGGERIVVDAQADADPRMIKAYLAGPALAILLHQRKAMPLHASCVARNGCALAFIGDSGVGKSTTAMQFRNHGYEVVSDDVVTFRMRSGGSEEREIAVNPAGRSPKLWGDAANMLGVDDTLVDAEYAGTAKGIYKLPPAAPTEPPRLDAIFFLRWIHPPDAEAEVTRLPHFEALTLLRKNIYRHPLVGMLGLEGEYMARLAALLQMVPVFVLARAYSAGTLPDIHEAVAGALRRE
jgi:hypothetical protein